MTTPTGGFSMFSPEGETLAEAVSKAKLDRDLQLAALAWVGRVEGALAALRHAGLLKERAPAS